MEVSNNYKIATNKKLKSPKSCLLGQKNKELGM